MLPFSRRAAGFTLFWLLGLLPGLTSCTEPAPPTDERRVFRYNQPESLTSLDPAFARNQANTWATTQLYNGLVELDDSLRPGPSVARRYQISPDGITYTFWLRPDVRFHDNAVFPGGKGRRVTAQDFVYSFKRLLDGATASPGGWIFRGKVLEKADGEPSDTCFVAVNDSTLRIHLKEPFIPFLGILTMPYAYVVPQEAVQKWGKDFRAHPVGTGPFRVQGVGRGQRHHLPPQPHLLEKGRPGEAAALPWMRCRLPSSRTAKRSS